MLGTMALGSAYLGQYYGEGTVPVVVEYHGFRGNVFITTRFSGNVEATTRFKGKVEATERFSGSVDSQPIK